MARRRNPDNIHVANLHGQATRYVVDHVPRREAIAGLVELANGRTDLLADAAASILGGYIAEPGMRDPQAVTVAGLLVEAGADYRIISERFDKYRKTATYR